MEEGREEGIKEIGKEGIKGEGSRDGHTVLDQSHA